MEINFQKYDNYQYLSFDGRLDALNSPDVEQEVAIRLQDCNKLVLDLGKLEYISSAGLRVLLIIAKKIQNKGGDLAICNLTER